MAARPLLASALVCAFVGCGGGDEVGPGVTSVFDVSDGAGLFAAPFPIAHRMRADGSLVVADFPNPHGNELLGQLVTLLESGHDGFSATGGIFVPFSAPIEVRRLPANPAASVVPDSTVFLVGTDPESPDYGRRIPIEVSFKEAAETYSPENLLVILPYQGVVLAPDTSYAAVVRRGLGDTAGRPLYPAETLEILLRGDVPSGPHGDALAEAFTPLRYWLATEGISLEDVAAATVFKTGNPLAEMTRWRDQVATQPPALVEDPISDESYEHYCVVRATTTLPVFQGGPKPYVDFGTGQIVSDASGNLVEQERDRFEIVLTIPKAPMPAEGYPLVLYAAGAEGKARQVVDRTAESLNPDEGLGPPGLGPARIYGARGIGALGFPAPLTWDRNPANVGGLFDFWNVPNLGAFRDNLRQGILDFASLVPLVQSLELDASLCPEAQTASGSFHYDPSRILLQGHSTGSTIGSAVIALEPDLAGVILSGAGGSWIYNVALAEAPIQFRSIAQVLLDYEAPDVVDIFDPALTLFQTALESIEVMNWGRATQQYPLPGRRARPVLLIEGVVDTYHFPRMVNAYAMSVGLDLVGPEAEPTAREDYALVGRQVLAPPVAANVDLPSGDVTGACIQREQNEENGHYVPFEMEDVKHRYGCFAQTLVEDGQGKVVVPEDDALAPCD
ncbi:MAG: hypothetical protein R3B72_31185 [Polyangiaceae bacterium]